MDIKKIFPLEYTVNGHHHILNDFTPINNQILIIPFPKETKTKSGLIISGGLDELKSFQKGIVVRVSVKESVNVSEGDVIFYQKMGELTLPLNFTNKDINLILIRGEWVVGKLE